ncbi:molybdenum cofactor biosynthesis protein MoaE [bacterium]|nr:molybdenum cofactor biosynthesis protein MoaE [bacterium]
MSVRVQSEDFDVGAELARLTDGKTAVGGVCVFVGLVRDMHKGSDGVPVDAMTLEHYPGMTERQLAAIEAEARARWPLDDVLIVHRYGRLTPGDRIVMSCRFLMDWLKTKAPFWKCEKTPAGERWVDAKADDQDAAARWEGRHPPPAPDTPQP